jgi:hypothetical protein
VIILGDELVPYEEVSSISSIDEIKTTKANSIVSFDFDEKLLKYCFENSLKCLVKVVSIKEAIYCNSLNALYIASHYDMAKKIQKVADNYMFDSKNLCIIKNNNSFEDVAKSEIDGVIYSILLDNK